MEDGNRVPHPPEIPEGQLPPELLGRALQQGNGQNGIIARFANIIYGIAQIVYGGMNANPRRDRNRPRHINWADNGNTLHYDDHHETTPPPRNNSDLSTARQNPFCTHPQNIPFLTLDSFLHRLRRNFDFIIHKTALLLQYINVYLWNIRRRVIQLLSPPLPPPSAPSMDPPTPKMTVDVDHLNHLLERAGWTRGRDVVVNAESNTISVYEDLESTSEESDLETIPLFFHDIPIIPHSFPRPSPSTAPPEFATEEPMLDGLSNEQIKVLRETLPGLERIEFYLDRIVVLTVREKFANVSLEKTGAMCFAAFGCVSILAVVNRTLGHRHEGVAKNEAISTRSIFPGSKVYNSVHAYSTLGAFLVPGSKYPSSEYLLEFFTVSAHSFLRKRSFDFGFTWPTLLAGPVVAYLALRYKSLDLFGISISAQYLFTRLWIEVYDIVNSRWGDKLGWRNLVCAHPSILTFSARTGQSDEISHPSSIHHRVHDSCSDHVVHRCLPRYRVYEYCLRCNGSVDS